MTQLYSYVIGALMIATLTVGLTGFISEGINVYGVNSNVQQGQLSKLKQMDNQTNLATKAKQRAENVNAKSNFFTLPGLIKTFKLAFQSIGLWDIFFTTSTNILGLQQATGNWLVVLASASIMVLIAFKFGGRII